MFRAARRACQTWAKRMCIVQEMIQEAPDEVAAPEAAVRAATSHVQNLGKIMVSNFASSMRMMTSLSVRSSLMTRIAQNRIQCFSQREGTAFW